MSFKMGMRTTSPKGFDSLPFITVHYLLYGEYIHRRKGNTLLEFESDNTNGYNLFGIVRGF